MVSSFVIIISASFICLSTGLVYDPELSKQIADASDHSFSSTQDSTKILTFLQEYIAHRSSAGGWKNSLVAKTKGFYCVCTVKLSNEGDVSCIMKHNTVAFEYTVLDNESLANDYGEVKSVPGVVYSATNTPYCSDSHQTSLATAQKYLTAYANSDYVKEKLPLLTEDQTRNVQVGYSIVKGVNCGNDVGMFLLVAAYIE